MSPGKKKLDGQEELFAMASAPTTKRRLLPATKIWTDSKARLIANYLELFQLVTHHGNYIDGFAAPQDERKLDAWSAALALGIQPEWFRRFYLFDIDPQGIAQLEELKKKHKDREIHIYEGDFNQRVAEILRPDVLPLTEAAFCLLDQRTHECEWATVETIADYKRGEKSKVELFYFLAEKWFARSYKSMKDPKSLARVEAWWGRDDWREVAGMRGPERLKMMEHRFTSELHYAFATSYAIHERVRGIGRVAYYMIHACDHPAAPRLMSDAYKKTIDPMFIPPQLSLEELTE